jgi:hypothetical protein
LLLVIFASVSFIAAQDTAPDQTAPQSQPKATWTDRFNQLKSAATSGIPLGESSTNGCNASELFGMGACQMLVNGKRDLLSWRRDVGGIRVARYITEKSGGQGIGGDMDYLGEDTKASTYYMQSADGIRAYTVTGTFPDGIKVTSYSGTIPDGLKGGSQEAYASQDDDSGEDLSNVLKPMGTPAVGYKASAFLPGLGWQQVTIDQLDKNGNIAAFHTKDNRSFKVEGNRFQSVSTAKP